MRPAWFLLLAFGAMASGSSQTTTDEDGLFDMAVPVAVTNHYVFGIRRSFPRIGAIYVSDNNGIDLPGSFYDSFQGRTIAIRKHSEWAGPIRREEMFLRLQPAKRLANGVYELIAGTSLGTGWGWCRVIVARKFSGWRVTAIDGCTAVSATQQSSQAKLNGSPKIIGNTRSQRETVKQIAMNGIRASISANGVGGRTGIGPVVYILLVSRKRKGKTVSLAV